MCARSDSLTVLSLSLSFSRETSTCCFDFRVVSRRTDDRSSRDNRIHVSELRERRTEREEGNRYCPIVIAGLRREARTRARRSSLRNFVTRARSIRLLRRPRSPRDSERRNEYRYTCNLYSSVSSQFSPVRFSSFVFTLLPFPFLYFFRFVRLSKSSSTSLEHHISNTS